MSDPADPQGSPSSSGNPQFPFAPKGGTRRPGTDSSPTTRMIPGGQQPPAGAETPYVPPHYQQPGYAPPSSLPPYRGGHQEVPVGDIVPAPRVLDEVEVLPQQKRQFWFLLIGFAIFFCVLVGVAGYSLYRSYRQVEEGSGKMGLLAMTLYNQSAQRMYLLTQPINAYVDQYGMFPPDVDALRGVGDPALTFDKWKRPFTLREGYIICLGADGELDTKDDMALNLQTFALESQLPDMGQVIADTKSLPPEMRTMLDNMHKQIQKATANQERMEAISEERSFDQPDWVPTPIPATPTAEEATLGDDINKYEPSYDQ